jgi:sarcosine oxidase subunit alpha
MMFRLPQPVAGEWIDRSRPLSMQFEGRAIHAFAGDTLTSALAASGVMVTARSFKYHRPRGLVSAAGHDANNLFQLGDEPNQRGDHILARDGLSFSAVNTRGGVAHDRLASLGLLSRFLPVGFYYKVFWGQRTFPWFERIIRRISGLGTVNLDARPADRERRYAHCDVAVVGAGLSGLSAALAAVAAGARRVVLIDESQQPGGSGLWHANTRPEQAARCRALIQAVRASDAIELMLSHSVVGCFADNELAVARIDREDGGLTLLRAGAVVLATGCIEQPAVFHGNDLPGVLLGRAAQRLLYGFGVAAGRRIAVLGANDAAVALALDLASQGLAVTDLLVPRDSPADPAPHRAALESAGVRMHTGISGLEARASADGVLAGVQWTADGLRAQVDCDALLMSVGWMPALQLALQRGGTIRFDEALGQHVPDVLPTGVFVAGSANGRFDAADRARDGQVAGERAAAHARGATTPAQDDHAFSDAALRGLAPARPQSHAAPLFPSPAGKEFVDLDEDLTLADLANAAQEGFDSVELLKRYSTVGMGPSQGKLSNLNAARQLARVTQRSLPSLGLTTARPPWQPVSLGALAGMRFSPERRTALDGWHEAHGATWMPAGAWRRPACYGNAGAAADAIAGEVAAVRNAVGLIDVSTLGKIEVMGPDAALLLERIYTGRFANLAPGRTRYAVMLDETGTVIDDGVVMRLADGRFYLTTTTSASASVYRELQRRVAEWGLECVLHNVTGHMAAMNLAGPKSAAVLGACTDLPLNEQAFPYLALREGLVAGHPARIARVGFVGELGYEIHVPFAAAPAVWQALMAAGAAHGIRPFGVEAQRVLRLEKGHIIIGQDTDGLTSPFEAGLERLVRMDKPFFVGQRSLAILARRGPRQQLAGFRLEAPRAPLLESNLAIGNGEIVGRITSIAWSATLGCTIGLAMLSPALTKPGTRVQFRDDRGVLHAAVVVEPPFYDPDNLRQRMEAA